MIELAVVLFIVSLLIGGLLLPLSAQMEVRGRQETDRALTNIRDALIGFAVINGRLPCPAVASIPTGTTVSGLAAGFESIVSAPSVTDYCACDTSPTSGIAGNAGAGAFPCSTASPNTDSVTGVLPWATLGLPEADAWDHRFTYRVSTQFARLASGQTTFNTTPPCTPTTTVQSAAFALCSVGTITVTTLDSGGTTIASGVPVIVISHGKNGLGAYGKEGSVAAAATAADEVSNTIADSVSPSVFVSNGGLDDQMTWIPTGILMGRMLSASKLP